MISEFLNQVNKLYSRRRVNVYKSIQTERLLACHAGSFYLTGTDHSSCWIEYYVWMRQVRGAYD